MMRALDAATRALSKMPAGAAKTRAAGEILTRRIPRAMLNAETRGQAFIDNISIPVPKRYWGKLLHQSDKMTQIRNVADRAIREWNSSIPYWEAGHFGIPKKTVTMRTDHGLLNDLIPNTFVPGNSIFGIKPKFEHFLLDSFMRDTYQAAVAKKARRALGPQQWRVHQYRQSIFGPRLGYGAGMYYSRSGKPPSGKLFHLVRESMKNTV